MGDTGGGFQYRRTGVIRCHHSDAVEILLVEEEKIKMRNKQSENYLDGKPLRNEKISWSVEDGQVTLEIENKGIWNTPFSKSFEKAADQLCASGRNGEFYLAPFRWRKEHSGDRKSR